MLLEELHHWQRDGGNVQRAVGAWGHVIGQLMLLGMQTVMPLHHWHPAEDGI